MSGILTAVGVFALAVVTLGLALLIGMRTKSPPVMGAIRRVNRAYLNPRQLQTAGQPGTYASIVRHIGRVSGQQYQTPVGAMPDGDHFWIALPYGTESEVVPVDSVAASLPADERRVLRLFSVEHCLRLRRVGERPDQD